MALYNLRSKFRTQEFKIDVNTAIEQKLMVEFKPHKDRTLNQNALMHVWFLCYAIFSGHTKNHVKQQIFKIELNADIFVVETFNFLTGDAYREVRSTAKITKEECCLAMDRFDKAATEMDLQLPRKEDKGYIREIKEEASRLKQYL